MNLNVKCIFKYLKFQNKLNASNVILEATHVVFNFMPSPRNAVNGNGVDLFHAEIYIPTSFYYIHIYTLL